MLMRSRPLRGRADTVRELRIQTEAEVFRLAKALATSPRWNLPDGPCWCHVKHARAAVAGEKVHSPHCRVLKDLRLTLMVMGEAK